MDLSALNSTLPPGLADVEREMGDKFRAAALSITTLYKTSLSATKQAYHSGYSACLSDVLSTVQSSIASGQDASQTLSRLMDWAEAREAAMAAFAADESDEPSPAAPGNTPAPVPRRAAMTKQAIAHLHAIQRPASAPVQEHVRYNTVPTGQSTPTAGSPGPSTQTWQPTPASFAASSPCTSASSSTSRPASNHASSSSRKYHHSPVRSSHRGEGSSTAHAPQSTFNPTLPALPTAGVPFVATTTPNLPIGSKRQLLDVDMTDESGPTKSTPSRASKRRSLGNSLVKEESGEPTDRSDKDRRRGRRGHGAGGAGGPAGI